MTAIVGGRIAVPPSRGTIAYIGPVSGTDGDWIGVDWDDPNRGKHDGSRGGVRYFQCREPGSQSGSFLRPTASSIVWGKPFLEALSRKYIDEHVADSPDHIETVLLGSSQGAIVVEAPRMQEVRGRLADLNHLREVSFDESTVNGPGEPGGISGRCQNVRGLDLSASLVGSWSDILAIVCQLPRLSSLVLNDNRFAPTADRCDDIIATGLQELHLNKTMMTLEETFRVARLFPGVRVLELGYNNLRSISLPPSPVFQTLESLNLDSNQLDDWVALMSMASHFPLLSRLVLGSNCFSEVPPLSRPAAKRPHTRALGLKHLSLASNSIHSWASVDSLAEWLPHLEGLSLQFNPILEDPYTSKHSRSLVTGRIGSLISFNGSRISSSERKDSELFYLSYIVRTVEDPVQRSIKHPRWEHLCKEYGHPEESSKGYSMNDTLGQRLIELSVRVFDEAPTNDIYRCDPSPAIASNPGFTVRVLPTMLLRTLRSKIAKTLKQSHALPSKGMRLWAVLRSEEDSQSGVLREMDLEVDGNKELDWWGLEAGSGVGVWIPK